MTSYVNLAPIVWELDAMNDDEVAELVNGAELLIAEYDAEHRDLAEFQKALASLYAYASPVTSATNAVIRASVYSSGDAPVLNNGLAAAS
jgi:hypothetical protein